jgi:hypothetical protein
MMAEWIRDVDGDFLNLDMADLICIDYVDDEEEESDKKYARITVRIKDTTYTIDEFDTSEEAYEYLNELGIE